MAADANMAARTKQLETVLTSNKVLAQRLEESNKQLEQEIERLRSANGQASTFRFLDLPPELRDMVYRLCVAPGKVFIRPRPEYDGRCKDMEKYSKPEWQLLATSQQMRKEAAAVLFKENQIIFNFEMKFETMIGGVITNQQPSAVALAWSSAKHLTSVSLSFDMRSLSLLPDELLTEALCLRTDVFSRFRWAKRTTEERIIHAHDQICSLTGPWEAVLGKVTGRRPPLSSAVRFLQIDVTNCYCMQGCCRLVCNVADALAECTFPPRLERIEVLGTKTQAERNTMISRIVNSEQDTLVESQPVLQFRAFRLDGTAKKDLMGLWLEGLNLELGDEQVDLRPLWEERLRE